MANQSVLELAVATGKWDAGLKKATSALNNFTQSNGGLTKALEKESQKMSQFVQMMGKMESTANTAKGQMRDYKAAIEQLTMQYNRMTDAQKNAIGQEYVHAIEQLREKYHSVSEEINDINDGLSEAQQKTSAFGGAFNAIAGKFGVSTSTFTKAGAAVAGVGLAFKLIGDNIATARNFEVAMSQLSSLTGKTGEDLEQLKEYAIELGSTTTLSASEVADAFKMIGSQQPQLLASSEALKDVTKSAITLSEAAGIDLATASQTLSTSINQFGGDSANATRFVNVLAAASQKGAGDISFLGEAITKSGVLANAVGVSYEELVANLEQLAQAGIDASTSGTALRGIIANLEKQSNDQFKPSVVGLTEAFSNLNKAQLTTVDYIGLCGKQFFSQAMVLAENADKSRELTEEITGTNTAEEQAKINTDNLDGSLKSLSSAWEGLNLHLNSSNGLLKTLVDWLTTAVTWVDKLLQKLNEYASEDWFDNMQNEVDNWNDRYGRMSGLLFGAHRGQGPMSSFFHAFTPTSSSTTETTTTSSSTTETNTTSSSSTGSTSGKGKPKKTGRGKGGGAHKVTPQERAQQAVDSALSSYAQTIAEADLRMAAGLDDTLAHKKKELSAQERLFEAYGKAYGIYADDKWKNAYNEAAEKYKSLAEEVKNETDARAAAKKAADDLAKKEKKAAEEQAKWNAIQSTPSADSVGSFLSMRGKKRSVAAYGSSEYNAIGAQMLDATTFKNIMEEGIKNGIDMAEFDPAALWKKILGDGVDDSEWQKIIDQLNEKLAKMSLGPIKLDINTGSISKGAKKVKEGWQDAAKAVQSVGSALQQVENPSVKIAGLVGEAIANIALGFAQATASSGKTMGVFGWIAAIAGGLGTMISTIAAIKNATAGSYAEGGIVPGSNFSGDNIPVMVNSGEVILNRAQAGNLASQLGGQSNGATSQPYISGEMIFLGLNSYLRRAGKGELMTSRY